MAEPDADPAAGLQPGLDRVPCGYLATDLAGRIKEINSTLLEWLGYRSEDVVGTKALTDLLTGGGRIYHETHYRPTLELHGEAREIAVELRSAGGGRIPVLLNSVLDGHGTEAPGMVRTAVFKATERRRYEHELLVARERAEASEAEALAIAHTLQKMLIPPAPAKLGQLDLEVAFRPAGDGGLIGGDFYDVFELASGDWMVVIGDVCGKGVDAAAIAARIRQLLRAAAVHPAGLDDLLRRVNQLLMDEGADRYSTLLVARFSERGAGCRLSLCSGGHPLPMLRTGTGDTREIGQHGSLVGIFREPVYNEVEVELAPGDLVLLYTDGVTEGRIRGELFGEERLHGLVAAGGHDVAHVVVDAVVSFQEGFAADDLAVITVAVPAR